MARRNAAAPKITLTCPLTEEMKWGQACSHPNPKTSSLFTPSRNTAPPLLQRRPVKRPQTHPHPTNRKRPIRPPDPLHQPRSNRQARLHFKGLHSRSDRSRKIRLKDKEKTNLRLQSPRRIPGQVGRAPRPESRLQRPHPRPPESLPPLFFQRQTIPNPRRESRKIPKANPKWKRIRRLKTAPSPV